MSQSANIIKYGYIIYKGNISPVIMFKGHYKDFPLDIFQQHFITGIRHEQFNYHAIMDDQIVTILMAW